jgi:hypothetical protein
MMRGPSYDLGDLSLQCGRRWTPSSYGFWLALGDRGTRVG